MDEASEIKELLSRIGAGQSAALEDLHRLMANRLFGLILKVLKDRHEAEDALQETFLKIWKKAGNYREQSGSALSWLLTVARNTAFDRYRARNRRSDQLETFKEDMKDDPAVNRPSSSADENLVDQERKKTVREALHNLGQDQREAIEMAFFSGHTQIEVSEKLGVPLGTIKARIRRGMQSLKPHLHSIS